MESITNCEKTTKPDGSIEVTVNSKASNCAKSASGANTSPRRQYVVEWFYQDATTSSCYRVSLVFPIGTTLVHYIHIVQHYDAHCRCTSLQHHYTFAYQYRMRLHDNSAAPPQGLTQHMHVDTPQSVIFAIDIHENSQNLFTQTLYPSLALPSRPMPQPLN